MPAFGKGQRYVIFTDPGRTVYNPITGNEHGVFLVEVGNTGVYSHEGIGISAVERGLLIFNGPVLKRRPEDGRAEVDPLGVARSKQGPAVNGGFDEWKRENGKTPYYFRLKDDSPFAFAGLWSAGRRATSPSSRARS